MINRYRHNQGSKDMAQIPNNQDRINRDAIDVSEKYTRIKHFYAHSREGQDVSTWQRLEDHLFGTGEMAYELGCDAGVSELARAAGILHDIGKYSQAFQSRLHGSNSRVDHSTAGSREILSLFPEQPHRSYAELISYCIAGHHSGLPDHGSMVDIETDATLIARREKKKLNDYSTYSQEIDTSQICFKPLNIHINTRHPGYSISFLTRMIFSALVDADWLDTEIFMNEGESFRGQYAEIGELCRQFNSYLERFNNPQSAINRRRTETLYKCIEHAAHPPGYFSLTVPTGGGKTLSSMAFALNHAVKHGLKRVIYIIPFTSIIEQNAAVFRKALGQLGEENILEHHSNFDWEAIRKASDDEGNSAEGKLKLASENWDIPIVVTTNVQFFESLFANKKSASRKIHNLASSVLVFDEVQMLPREYLRPCMAAVNELVQNYHSSVVFCTATQPSLHCFFPEVAKFEELASDPQELFDFYHRVTLDYAGTMTDDDLLNQMNQHSQALCIVNTRRHAKGLYDGLHGDGRFHLSTLMCPAHRKETLSTIIEDLKNGKDCRVVSTQVMEAGIDVDFPIGYRAMAGLDSIIQAAGRVNREGKRAYGSMLVFDPKSDFIKRTPTFIQQTASVARSILRNYPEDPVSIEAIRDYFNLLYTLQDERGFDTKDIMGFLDKGAHRIDFDFRTASEKFKLIDESTQAVIIPFNDEAKSLIRKLEFTLHPSKVLRSLQIYSVNIYDRELLHLLDIGALQTICDQYFVLDDSRMDRFYHKDTGLILPSRSGGDAIFSD